MANSCWTRIQAKTKLRLPRHHSALTLVEVVVAIAIAAMVSIGMYGSAIYTLRQTTKNLEQVYALQMASSAGAKVRAANFGKIAGTHTASDFENQFFSATPVLADPNQPTAPKFTITYEMKGFGKGIKKQNKNWSILTLPDGSSDWEKNEFAGRLIAIVSGTGANQVMTITQNHASGVKNGVKTVFVRVDQNLVDPEAGTDDVNDIKGPAVTWAVTPDTSSVFAVDYGLYCDVIITWGDGLGYKKVTESVYVPSS